MADAYWIQVGTNLAFALEVGGQLAGIAYWVDSEVFGEGAGEDSPAIESGWYWMPVSRPREPHRVAQGLEFSKAMSQDELDQTLHQALEIVANEVLAEGGER